ncbi:hypothetical protein [Halarchaeum grantii]|nr:hypothetical protein [Halarchaeum grantii]
MNRALRIAPIASATGLDPVAEQSEEDYDDRHREWSAELPDHDDNSERD